MKNPKTFYIREPSPWFRGKPVACVVYERHKDPDIDGQDYVIFAYSICAPGDEFVKKEGRRIATERLNISNSGKSLAGFTLDSDSSASLVIRRTMEEMLTEPGVPRRVQKIVKEWFYDDELPGVAWQDQVNKEVTRISWPVYYAICVGIGLSLAALVMTLWKI